MFARVSSLAIELLTSPFGHRILRTSGRNFFSLAMAANAARASEAFIQFMEWQQQPEFVRHWAPALDAHNMRPLSLPVRPVVVRDE